MKEISDHRELVALCEGDTLCLWVAQGLNGRSRAWRSADGRAVGIAGPALSTRDRLALRGPVDSTVALAREILDEVGPSYRPLGERGLIGAVVGELSRLEPVGMFGWMYTRRRDAHPPVPTTAEWLAGAALAEVTALLEASFPASMAKPGAAGAERWAGVRDDAGRLVATGTLAWCAPDVALIAGVAVHPCARGRGLGSDICAFLLNRALHRHEAVALMVDDWNHAARRLYRSLGLRYQAVAAAAVRSEPPERPR